MIKIERKKKLEKQSKIRIVEYHPRHHLRSAHSTQHFHSQYTETPLWHWIHTCISLSCSPGAENVQQHLSRIYSGILATRGLAHHTSESNAHTCIHVHVRIVRVLGISCAAGARSRILRTPARGENENEICACALFSRSSRGTVFLTARVRAALDPFGFLNPELPAVRLLIYTRARWGFWFLIRKRSEIPCDGICWVLAYIYMCLW